MELKSAVKKALTVVGIEETKLEVVRSRVRRALQVHTPKKYFKLLNEDQEKFLCDLISSFSSLANPLTVGDIRILAQVLGELPNKPTTGWMREFLKRHKNEVAIRKGKKSHAKKDLLGLFKAIKDWTLKTDLIIKELILDDDMVFNIDETRAIPKCKMESLLAPTSVFENHFQDTLKSTLYSLVTCICADGTTLL